MKLDLHPKTEKTLLRLVDFHGCVNPGHLITDWTREAEKDKDFQKFLSDPPSEKSSEPTETVVAAKFKPGPKLNGVHSTLTADPENKTEARH